MPVAKKERANHKCWWQPKNGFPNSQANSLHQMKETKQLKSPQNRKWLSTCKHKVEKPPKTNKQNHQITKV